MNTYKKTAILVGVLYIIGTIAGILSVVFTNSTLNDAGYLVKIAVHDNQVIIGALFVLTMGFALAMIPALMFPLLKKQNEALAVGYVVFRGALETVTYIVAAIIMLSLLTLSREYSKTSVPDAASFQTLGAVLKGVLDLPMTIFAFGLGALIFYSLLYQSNLIPRWLAVWGLIAILLHLATGVLIVFDVQTDSSPSNSLMNLPILLQEMVMAIWLIVKGFNPSALAALSAKTGH